MQVRRNECTHLFSNATLISSSDKTLVPVMAIYSKTLVQHFHIKINRAYFMQNL